MEKKYTAMIAWGILLGLIVLCYWPGLHGGFVFDDDVNILQNSSLKIKNGEGPEFWAAAVSGHAGPLGRPVALLSFALNYYWAGAFNPFQFKLVNLVIHLINAILVGCLAQSICRVIFRDQEIKPEKGAPWAGWTVAALWALHPLNLTGVLYAVQRMTSLCTLFGLAGLVIFVWYRGATYSVVKLKRPLVWGAICAVGVACCLLLSLLTKESGALFAPLLLWAEWCVFRFRYGGAEIRLRGWRLRPAVAWAVVLAVAYVGICRVPSMVGAEAYANREFTLTERGLTEARVLVFYLRMLVFPANSQLSLYHDDFELSHSLLSPPATLVAFAILFLITAAAWLLRRRFGVLLFGWGWFLISHALESTIFPLELVYEHRNYFAIIGPLLAVPVAMGRADVGRHGRLMGLGLLCYLALLGFITHVRSLQWSNTIDWAALEAENRPASMRAGYEVARVYMILMKTTGDEKFGQLADDAFARSARADPAAMLPLVARAQLAYVRGAAPAPELIAQIRDGFKTQKYRNANTAALTSMVTCQIEQKCRMADHDVLDILAAATENPLIPRSERAEVVKLMAQYRINMMRDLPAGVDLIRQSIGIQDKAPSRIMYAQALAMSGKFDDALLELDRADALDGYHEFTPLILRERKNIQEAMHR
ncbi:MAG: hypothetical protein QM586_13220 [Xenophilus sp.]